MSDNQKLLLNFNNPSVITNICGDFLNNNNFSLDAIIGDITSVEIISNSVLIIRFDMGELRLDINKNSLLKLSKVINNEL